MLSTPKFDPEWLKYLAPLEQLVTIYITLPVGDNGLSHLCRLAQLRRIEISSEGLSQSGIQQLAALPHLKHLELNGNLDVTEETRRALGSITVDDGSWKASKRQLSGL